MPENNVLSVCVLAGGSKGNSVHVSDGQTALLVDAGLSGAEIQRRMKVKGLSPEALDGIFVTHEHWDHIQGVGVLSRRFGIPVYINPKTEEAGQKRLGDLHSVRHIECGIPVQVNKLAVRPFSISHDTADPSGFTISSNGTKVGIATDLGMVTEMVRTHLRDCRLLVIEANHDPKMLTDGPYPWPLKQRIRGRLGHLSNRDTRDLITDIRHEGLSHLILSHLSETNNTPEKALAEILPAVEEQNTRVCVAAQNRVSEIFRLASI